MCHDCVLFFLFFFTKKTKNKNNPKIHLYKNKKIKTKKTNNTKDFIVILRRARNMRRVFRVKIEKENAYF